MPHPVLDEIVRAKLPLRPEVLRRWQQVIQREVIPAMEAAESVEPRKAKGAAA